MWNKIKEMWSGWSTVGLKLPFMFDPVEKKPSVTLVFPYVTFAMACGSVLALHFFQGLLTATMVSIGFWAAATILYMIRKVNKMKVNFTDKSMDIENNESNPKPEPEPESPQ
jgi:hypothetical protein